MNLKFLGDALDHWKGSVFEGLQNSNILTDFRVDAMASDIENWRPEDWSLFAKLLKVKNSQIVSHETTLNINKRQKYFEEIPHSGDLFLDPDTGIRTGSVKDSKQYLNPDELFFLMNRGRRRVVIVYQHVRAVKTRERCEAVLKVLCSKSPTQKFYSASYDSGMVTMLFFSFNKERIELVNDYLRELLGYHAENRIGVWI